MERRLYRSLPSPGFVLAVLLLMLPLSVRPDTADEPYNAGWALHIDNDLIFSSGNDQDYTGGVALTLSGARADHLWWAPSRWRRQIDRWIGLDACLPPGTLMLHAAEAGFALFTPIDLQQSSPQPDDHPYASLFFVVNSKQYVLPESKLSLTSTLTLGALGLSVGGEVQQRIHRAIGATQPNGWAHQISAGGEPTARYTLGLQRTLIDHRSTTGLDAELSLAGEANLGFTTDINAGLSLRVGRLSTPWWGFKPHQAEYVNLGAPVPLGDLRRGAGEIFAYAGANVKLRAYNALLQGQFRHSAVSFGRSELHDVLREVWAGISYEMHNRLKLTLFLRGRSAEIRNAKARQPVWGGFVVSKSY